VSGATFRSSTTDVAVAGLGWFGVAAAGDVQLRCDPPPLCCRSPFLCHGRVQQAKVGSVPQTCHVAEKYLASFDAGNPILGRVWALEGVAITTRDSMVPDLAPDLERPGFSNVGGGGTAPNRKRGGGGRK
jgi:hypothetical protein